MADSPPPIDDVDLKQDEEPLFAETEVPDEFIITEGKDPEIPELTQPVVSPTLEPTSVPPPTLEATSVPPPTLEPTAAEDTTPEEMVMKESPSLVESASSKPLDLFDKDDDKDDVEPHEEKAMPEEEEEEEGDTFELNITVKDPEKIGDGMSAYVAYSITTKTSMPSFKSSEVSVKRRFSDFLGLGQRISEKYMQKGCIVPPTPEKNVVGMTKVKFSKSDENNAFFLERRRAALERYLNRIANHPMIRKDDDFREFLENPNELPKASDTAALSGAGFMRLVKNVGDSFSKIAGKKAETDSWFDEQQQNFEVLDSHLKKLHSAVESMTACRKDLCANTEVFAKSVATLGNVEENDTVSRALARLAEVEEKVETLHEEQFNSDLYIFGETVKDYVSILASIKITFQLRVKTYNTWQSAQTTLAKKRENEVKLQTAGKMEKLPQAKSEIIEWEKKVDESQKSFDRSSKTLKKEVIKFESERTKEFKAKFIMYLESLMKLQQELVKLWENYLPDAQAIA